MSGRRCVRVATTTEVMGDRLGGAGAGGRAARRESVARRPMLGESPRRMKRGSRASGGMERAMAVVTAVVAGLDVVVDGEREGKVAGLGRQQASLVLWPSSYREDVLPQAQRRRLSSGSQSLSPTLCASADPDQSRPTTTVRTRRSPGMMSDLHLVAFRHRQTVRRGTISLEGRK